MSDTIEDIIGCIIEDKIPEAVEAYWEENPIAPAIDEAISEHDTVLNLIHRVEELEKVTYEITTTEESPPAEIKPEGELKPVSTSCTQFQICEDQNYHKFLTRKHDEEQRVLHLYAVTFQDSWINPGGTTFYVLAEDGKLAIGQAACGLRLSYADKVEAERHASVVQLPLLIRAWGNHQF